MIQFLIPKQRNKTFYFAVVKNNFNIYESCLMFGENSFIPAAFSVKLIVINPSYLKKLYMNGKTFTKLTLL